MVIPITLRMAQGLVNFGSWYFLHLMLNLHPAWYVLTICVSTSSHLHVTYGVYPRDLRWYLYSSNCRCRHWQIQMWIASGNAHWGWAQVASWSHILFHELLMICILYHWNMWSRGYHLLSFFLMERMLQRTHIVKYSPHTHINQHVE